MATLQELLDQKQQVERQIRDAQTSIRFAAIAEIRSLMHENGLTVADLAIAPSGSRKSKSSVAGRTVAPKYRNGETGVTWSGRGLKPRWLSEALASGRSLEDFAIG